MQVARFGLGIRFDMVDQEQQEEAARRFWEEIFSVLTAADVSGLNVYGGVMESGVLCAGQEQCYLCVFTGGGLRQMRGIYRKLDNDAGVNMYLSATRPFIQNNTLNHIEGLTNFGRVQRGGGLLEGDAPLFGVTIHKRRGKRRPVGKGIRFLLAPEEFGPELNSNEVVKRLTVAARRQFPGVRILPLPITCGGPGTVASLLSGCDGAARTVTVMSLSGEGEKTVARYGVLMGTLAVLEAASTVKDASKLSVSPLTSTSYGLGELIRRALDEGVREVLIGVDQYPALDAGLGCLKALGVSLLDADGKELPGTAGDLLKVRRLDAEFLHPRIKDAAIAMLYPGAEAFEPELYFNRAIALGVDAVVAKSLSEALLNYCSILTDTFSPEAQLKNAPGTGAAGGIGLVLQCAFNASFTPGVGALLDAAKYDKRMREISLVVTGKGFLGARNLEDGQAFAQIARRCAKYKVPLAVIAGTLEKGIQPRLLESGAGSVVARSEGGEAQFATDPKVLLDDAAERMFRFVRMGRDIERVTALKRKKR